VGNTIIAGLKSINGPVLITGHTGFKGTWMTLLLEKLGIEWFGISLQPASDSLYNLINHKNSKNEYFIDIRDYDKLKKILITINPKFIIHLAAQPLVLDSYNEPRLTFETNVLGAVNLLDIATKHTSVAKVIIATTDKVYKEKKLKKTFRENDSLGGKDPYSWSKVGTEAAIGAWQQISKTQNGPKIISVRSGNVVGGGDRSKNRLLPDLINGFIKGSTTTIRNPDNTRPWQHVLDPLYGYLLAISSDTKESTFNFSPDTKSLSVSKVTEIARNAWTGSNTVIFNKELNQLETASLSINSKKARKILKWKSIWKQEDAIISTVKWWQKTNAKEISHREACFNNIDELLNEI
jgi:CDP-glucose 4,6-dehydratase